MKNEIKTINIIIANLECKVTFFFFFTSQGAGRENIPKRMQVHWGAWTRGDWRRGRESLRTARNLTHSSLCLLLWGTRQISEGPSWWQRALAGPDSFSETPISSAQRWLPWSSRSLRQPEIRETQQPLATHHHAAWTAGFFRFWIFFFFSLSLKAKETAQRSLTHVIWKYCDSQEIGLVSRETTVAVSFLLFLKSNFDLSSPVRKKFTKYTSVGACVDSSVYLLSDVGDIFPVPHPLPAFGFLPLGLCPMLLNLWDKGFEERWANLSPSHICLWLQKTEICPRQRK